MRTLSALLVVVLLCSLQQVCSGIAVNEDVKMCCDKLTTLPKIPLRRIVSYWRTTSNCHFQAIMFKDVKGNSFCVDPSLDWVKSHIKAVDQRKNKTTTAKH